MTPTLRYVIITAAFFLLCSPSMFAQLPPDFNRPDLREEASRMERYYEIILRNSLAEYYSRETFLVDVNVELEEVMIPTSFERPGFIEEPVRLEQLPGLPFIPGEFLHRAETPNDSFVPSEFERALQISNLTVNILADNSYDQNDLNFIRALARSVAKTDEFRGDAIFVNRQAFPRSAREREMEEERQRQRDQDEADFQQAVREQMTMEGQPAAEEDTAREPEQDNGLILADIPVIWYVLAGVILLIFLLLFALLFRTRERGGALPANPAIPGNNETDEAYQEILAELEQLKKERENEKNQKKSTAEQLALYEADRSYITNQYISRPQAVAGLLSRWIADDPDEGYLKAAKAVNSINPKLLSTLRPNMKKELLTGLYSTIEIMEPMSGMEKIEQASRFRKSLQSNNEQEDAPEESDMFGFLNQLTANQLLHLLKDETDEVIAIALAQLKGDLVGEVVQRIDEARQGPVLVKMGKMDNYPVSALKQVADQLSDKALEIYNMKYVAADGVQSILSVIDALPVDKQDSYFRQISSNDLELANKVSKYFVAYKDIPKMDDKVLSKGLEDVETRTLVLALINSEPDISQKILELRPQRERMLIKSEIENITDVKPMEIEQARRELLLAIRKKMQEVS